MSVQQRAAAALNVSQLPPFFLGSKFLKRCEWGGREISLKSRFVAASPLHVVSFRAESGEWVFSAGQLMVGS